MDIGEVRVANDSDFETLQTYLNENDGWSVEYKDECTTLWSRMPPQTKDNFKMIRVRIWEENIFHIIVYFHEL